MSIISRYNGCNTPNECSESKFHHLGSVLIVFMMCRVKLIYLGACFSSL